MKRQPGEGKAWTRRGAGLTANDEGEVVVLWRQRGRSPSGERFDSPVLGLYQVREGKFARAQMFYFDAAAVLSFLDSASG